MTVDVRELSAAVREIRPAAAGSYADRAHRTSELAREAERLGLSWIALHLHEQRVALGGERAELIESAGRIAVIAAELRRPPHEAAPASAVADRPPARSA